MLVSYIDFSHNQTFIKQRKVNSGLVLSQLRNARNNCKLTTISLLCFLYPNQNKNFEESIFISLWSVSIVAGPSKTLNIFIKPDLEI